MLKKLTALVLILVLSISTLCLAEETSAIHLTSIMNYMPSLEYIEGTHYVIVKDKMNQYGVYTTSGEMVITSEYLTIEYAGYDYFKGQVNQELNSCVLINAKTGVRVCENMWADVLVLNKHWAGGGLCMPAEESSIYTIDVNGKKAVLTAYQFINLDTGTVVGSVNPDTVDDFEPHGCYITIEDSEGTITVYNNAFQDTGYKADSVSKPLYGEMNYQLVSLPDNKPIFDGITSATEYETAEDLVLLVCRRGNDNQNYYGVVNMQGEVIMPIEYTSVSLTDGRNYAVLDQNKQKGLYDLVARKQIVPCAYDRLLTNSTNIERSVSAGYVAVEKNGCIGFVDTRTGTLTCDTVYAKNSVTVYGCVLTYTENNKLTLVAADGFVSHPDIDSIYGSTTGNGTLLTVRKSGRYGLIDWHGNIILPCEYYDRIEITGDSRAVFTKSTGYTFLVVEE